MGYAITILGTSVLALLLAGYFAQRYLPPPTPKIVGIDLGTTFSCVAVYQAITGQVRVLQNANGDNTIPSIISYTDDGLLVGYEALAQAEKNPTNTLYDAKRFIGKIFSTDQLQKEGSGYGFKVITTVNGSVEFLVGEPGNYTAVSPEMVGTNIIRTLRQTAEANLSVPVTKAVMAVPAEFDERQRNQTKLAAQLAGIDVLRIINEPTAAALAYGLHKRKNIRTVVVVDIGGGTSDISLLNVQGGMFLTQSMAGNNHLGGQDFNQRLFKYLLNLIETKYNTRLVSPEDLQSLRLAVENLKVDLTTLTSSILTLPIRSLGMSAFTYNVTRQTFNKINEDLFLKVVVLLDAVLRPVETTPSDVDEVVLVGGSTRIPRIREIITDYFGKPPNVGIDPELAVVYGVAIQAGIIGGVWPLQVSAIEIPAKLKKINVQ